MSDLRERLQASLGNAYTLERELGGGGMSRVFVADETAFGRKVVVKVLPPDLAAGVSVERFKREIQVAARLQHPHIVPVLSAGETDGLPFYTMPLVEGSSLRARLGRGTMAITEVVSILREVARALAYAHERGVVHRDIKPDNVMLTGGSAVVTDFGIAKAISAARTDGGQGNATLTQVGVSLGTPAYMAPEQAAGDPATDHRADIYAFGVMGFELLTGRPPFFGLPAHKVLAAHLSEEPPPVTDLRADTPPLLAELIMRCLEKDADARPQSAADLASVLDTVTSGSAQPALPAALLGGRGMLRKALLYYAVAFVVVAVVARAAIVGIGLPDWVFPGALFVMLLGLPVILFTAYVQRTVHRTVVTTPQLTPGGSPSRERTIATLAIKAAPHISWRRTTLGGLYAVGGFVALVGAWMLMRALGIGPAASLMAAGKMGQRERVIIADFRGPPNDSLLGLTVTEAFRTDLAQSTSLAVLPATAVREMLRRMQRPDSTRVDLELARQIATREGIKAVVDGDVVSLGGAYVLSVRLVATQTGEELATLRETADETKEIIGAISRLSKKLRSKVGESLRTIQNAQPLERVSTPSLEALQKYVAGIRAFERDGDFTKGRVLLEEAIALDTAFAMAYRKLATELNNQGGQRALVMRMMQKAFDHRDRLSEAERYLTMASYYTNGPTPDLNKAVAAYEALIDLDPENYPAINNAATIYQGRREFEKAERFFERAAALRPTSPIAYGNLIETQVLLGKVTAAESTAARLHGNLPEHPQSALFLAELEAVRQQYDSAASRLVTLRRERAGDVRTQRSAAYRLADIALIRGRLDEASGFIGDAHAAEKRLGIAVGPLTAALDDIWIDVWYRSERNTLPRIERALREHPLEKIADVERPYGYLVQLYSLAGDTKKAKEMLLAFTAARAETRREVDDITRHYLEGHIALAERRYADAIREYRAGDAGSCMICAAPQLAQAYDLAGKADSAIIEFERYLGGTDLNFGLHSAFLAGAHKRLAELYDERGEHEKARSHYARFIELWKDADPELQPLVRAARERLARLQRAER